jgi:hypothetical protein
VSVEYRIVRSLVVITVVSTGGFLAGSVTRIAAYMFFSNISDPTQKMW